MWRSDMVATAREHTSEGRVCVSSLEGTPEPQQSTPLRNTTSSELLGAQNIVLNTQVTQDAARDNTLGILEPTYFAFILFPTYAQE